jgi:dihydrofolate reductase
MSRPEKHSPFTVALIAAVADNRVIGAEGGLPWHYPADMTHFRETTMGHPVVLGRVTYESIVDDLGGPLPGRTNVVLTGQNRDLPEGAVAVGSVEAALAAAGDALDEERDTVYVAGGANVYEQCLPLADRLVLTEVARSPDGDAFFPEVDWDDWEVIARDDRAEFAFVTYERSE